MTLTDKQKHRIAVAITEQIEFWESYPLEDGQTLSPEAKQEIKECEEILRELKK